MITPPYAFSSDYLIGCARVHVRPRYGTPSPRGVVHVRLKTLLRFTRILACFVPTPQTRMLFNQNFSARFTSAKMFAVERERQQARGWLIRESGGRGGGGNNRTTSPPQTMPGAENGISSVPPPQRPSVPLRTKVS